eukprot:CAMPEP_0116563776 /NCGR_PEP_ID=MMETSP0397-20121206/12930_1 /TAXON_ID=216820 /ORGANISM="Cyclophora tenuis, Strain ECT3854" /LENGTH=198 /DNA_ID=CAMNT_0004090275 /DNA_START=142 /DNA_END=735 /DNA_ORIENTATION=-
MVAALVESTVCRVMDNNDNDDDGRTKDDVETMRTLDMSRTSTIYDSFERDDDDDDGDGCQESESHSCSSRSSSRSSSIGDDDDDDVGPGQLDDDDDGCGYGQSWKNPVGMLLLSSSSSPSIKIDVPSHVKSLPVRNRHHHNNNNAMEEERLLDIKLLERLIALRPGKTALTQRYLRTKFRAMRHEILLQQQQQQQQQQ